MIRLCILAREARLPKRAAGVEELFDIVNPTVTAGEFRPRRARAGGAGTVTRGSHAPACARRCKTDCAALRHEGSTSSRSDFGETNPSCRDATGESTGHRARGSPTLGALLFPVIYRARLCCTRRRCPQRRSPTSSNHSSSDSTATPRSLALDSLEPAPGPATT
jgi:hypothetical protein